MARHPIYSGLLLALTGSAIVFGQIRDLAAVVLITFGWWLKTRVEEAFMTHQFGAEYLQYSQRVKALIPKSL